VWNVKSLSQLSLLSLAKLPLLVALPNCLFGEAINTFLPQLNDPQFWQDFWPNFLADFVVGVIIAAFISWILARINKRALRVSAFISNRQETTLDLTFFLENTGRVGFMAEEIYYHVLLSGDADDIEKVERDDRLARESLNVGEETFSYFKGLLHRPVFPGRRTELFTVRVKIKPGQFDMYYYLSTAYGTYPKSYRENKEGWFLLNTLGKVSIRGTSITAQSCACELTQKE
jgi:hypothetical protein